MRNAIGKGKAKGMLIVGYADRTSAMPGQKIRFMVSSEVPRYNVQMLRLIHGDDNPAGPGIKTERIGTHVNGDYRGRRQAFHHGSYIIVRHSPQMMPTEGFTIQCWIYPTTPMKGTQGIITKWAESSTVPGYGLFINSRGETTLKLRAAKNALIELSSERALIPHTWHFVSASCDGVQGKLTIRQEAVAPCQLNSSDTTTQRRFSHKDLGENDLRLLIGAYWKGEPGRREVTGHYNGKIDGPKLFKKALDVDEVALLKLAKVPTSLQKHLIAEWDFSSNPHSTKIVDRSPNKLDGVSINFPGRGGTGHNWSGQEHDFKRAPEQYNAIHFHDDDLGDCGWEADFEFTIPAGMRSGVYAAHLLAGESEDYITFFVRPKKGVTSSRIAFLASTLTYLAYGNWNLSTAAAHGVDRSKLQSLIQPQDIYIRENRLLSLYDHHSDGSGVSYASMLRPILSSRPGYNQQVISTGDACPHGFNADLHLIDWLEAMGFECDVITDHDLHEEGLELIAKYRVLITGSHPEYTTSREMDALEEYLNNGGRIMYLGGNGFYWVTAVNPDSRHMVEVRRWHGSETWEAMPGEYYSSFTGELGGLWRSRGKSPQKLFGVGFTAQGIDVGRPYARAKVSFDKSVSFVFRGVARTELIGDFDSLVMKRGAAGLEVDRIDSTLGSPSHTRLLATAVGFSDYYQHVIEENFSSNDQQGGTKNDLVRADMAYVKYPNGGAVFSVGSISWCGALSFKNYKNNVSLITRNVLKEFSSAEQLP